MKQSREQKKMLYAAPQTCHEQLKRSYKPLQTNFIQLKLHFFHALVWLINTTTVYNDANK